MNIEIWTDLTCPFCYMASHNFETALEEFSHTDNLNIIWRSFELDPDAPFHYEGNQYSFLAAKYNKTEQEIIEMTLPVVEEGASMGLTFNFDTAKPVNTFDAHRLLYLAAKHGEQKTVRKKLYTACFTEGRNISRHDILMSIGVESGLNETDIKEMLRSEAYGNLVKRDEKKAQETGITGVPRFLIEGKHLIKGNKKPEQFLEELTKAWKEKHVGDDTEEPQPAMRGCSGGRCEV